MGAPIMSLLIAILAKQEPRKWSEVSLSSLQSGHKGSERSFMIVRCLLRETCPVSSPVSRTTYWMSSCFLRLNANLAKPGFGPLIYNLVCLHPGFCCQEIRCSLRTHFRRFDRSVVMDNPNTGSGPVQLEAEACLASKSAFSLPSKPQCPGTHRSLRLLCTERSCSSSMVSATSAEVTLALDKDLSAA